MAEQTSQDVVEQAQSVGDLSLPDVPATTTKTQATEGDERRGSPAEDEVHRQTISQLQPAGDSEAIQLNGNLPNGGVHRSNGAQDDATLTTEIAPSRTVSRDASRVRDDSILDDSTAFSDTDGSRAEGSITGDDRSQETSKAVKRFPTAKPVSFAKYSVPGKTIATNGPVKSVVEKSTTSGTLATPLQMAGRPRLVAKTTISLQQKAKPYKSAAPDPMQVWNKNRVTPQPSTKHLTDEELKQQYGIHMTSRMQDDGEGKEAKWADIDDDEDDWAPTTTIEWTDGTKSTVAPTEVIPAIEKKAQADPDTGERAKPVQPSKILTSQFPSSVGPNATVLKLGAGRQQAQKAAVQQTGGSAEKSPQPGIKTNLAPPPVKSPWAALPPVDKVSPVTINPQMAMPLPQRHPSSNGFGTSPATMTAPSPAKEISADDFSRSWRESASNQSRELYMPSSGKYEAVPENRRRMSKNEQNFRKPAVLQRPSGESHTPAEPSAAFQTSRTSTDQVRRRASSSISGGSGPFLRRTSVTRSSEAAPVFVDANIPRRDSVRPESREGPPSQAQTPTYQARGGQGSSYFNGVPGEQGVQSDGDIELNRAQQQLMMKEKGAQARKRKAEEEARREAEKQERIRLKLASLGPLVPADKVKSEEPAAEPISEPTSTFAAHSPPKPPLPLATGEPQQYGMMKVHPMDSVKKPSLSSSNQHHSTEHTKSIDSLHSSSEQPQSEPAKLQPAPASGARPISDSHRQPLQENTSLVERSPRVPKAISVGPEARAGWPDVRNSHHAPPSANLWGLPNNKALGNGTFDRGLGDYGSQALSAQNSSYGAQGWTNGRTSIQEKSPNIPYTNGLLSEGRSPLLSTIPADQQSLAADSEVDSVQPASRPGPIGPPQPQTNAQSWQSSPNLAQASSGIAAWSNFQQHAGPQERADSERVQRELDAKLAEEARTGIRAGPQYIFNETWKQVKLGEQAGQRHISGVAQSTVPASKTFGAVGSVPAIDVTSRQANGVSARGSRFFPQSAEAALIQNRRVVTYSHPEPPGSPSPPPAEEYASLHPAFDGDYMHPIVHFPREKVVVKLPPAKAPSPPTPLAPASPELPLSWAARVSQSAPQQPMLRTVSTPIAQTPSWQARFDGLLRKPSPSKAVVLPVDAWAVASSSREPWDVSTAPSSAAVSLPQENDFDSLKDSGKTSSKDVEDEEDLFEDREAGSLPIVRTPRDGLPVSRPRAYPPPILLPTSPVDAVSIRPYMTNNTLYKSDDYPPPTVLIYFVGMVKPVEKTLMNRVAPGSSASNKSRNASGSHGNKNPRNKSMKSRQGTDAPPKLHQSGLKSGQPSGTRPSSQGQLSGSSTQPASPRPSGNHGSQHSTPPATQANGHTRGPRNHMSHGSRGWKGKQSHPQPQAQTAH